MTIEGPAIPDFLNKSLFEKALRDGLNIPTIDIYEWSVSMGSKAGDNYCSEIYRCQIVYGHAGARGINISLIVKAMPYQPHRGPVMEELQVFEKEVAMYTKIIPRIAELLDGEYICAKCFYATKVPEPLIIFEDLKPLGYVMADRHNGLDGSHSRLVLEKLGRFHAASMVLAQLEPHIMDTFTFGMIKPDAPPSELMESIFTGGLSTLTEVVQTWSGQEEMVKLLKQAQIDYMKKLQKLAMNAQAKYKVLNHGDFWVNNYLFKYEEGQPIDVIFVDFQLSFYTSPAIDINYFLHTSPSNGVRQTEREDILVKYYEQFNRTLENSIVLNVPTKSMLDSELKEYDFYGFMAAVGILPIVLLNPDASKEANLEAMADADAGLRLRNAMYFGTNYQNAMKDLLPKFHSNNTFDKLKDL